MFIISFVAIINGSVAIKMAVRLIDKGLRLKCMLIELKNH